MFTAVGRVQDYKMDGQGSSLSWVEQLRFYYQTLCLVPGTVLTRHINRQAMMAL